MRLLPRYAASLAGLALLAVLLAACGGGDENEPSQTGTPASSAIASPTAAATAEDLSQAEALLKAAALQLEDLPSGFTLDVDEEKFTTNEEAAEEGAPDDPTLEDLNRWGRILGYEVRYSREVSLGTLLGGTAFLGVSTAVYRDSAGARDAFEFTRQRTSDPEFAKTFEASAAGEVRDASISPMSFAEVGEDRIAFEMKFTMHNPDLNTDFDYVTQMVAVRRDRGIGSITVLAVTSPSPVDELEELARKLDERMKDALE